MALLEVTGISKNFGSTHVLQNISLNLEKGEALAIIGSSGSGKTTLLRCLNFLETPDTGVIRVDGKTLWDAADPATHRESEVRKKRLHFGLVFQNFNLFPQYTACRTLPWPGSCWQKKNRSIKPTAKRFMRNWKKKPAPFWHRWAFRSGKTITRTSFPAASNSVWLLPAPWRWNRISFALMNQPAPLTRS